MESINIVCRTYLFEDQLTPYMHVLINHSAEIAQHYGNLTAFEMEEIEYMNYENKLIFFGASNKLSNNTYTSEQVIYEEVYLCFLIV